MTARSAARTRWSRPVGLGDQGGAVDPLGAQQQQPEPDAAAGAGARPDGQPAVGLGGPLAQGGLEPLAGGPVGALAGREAVRGAGVTHQRGVGGGRGHQLDSRRGRRGGRRAAAISPRPPSVVAVPPTPTTTRPRAAGRRRDQQLADAVRRGADRVAPVGVDQVQPDGLGRLDVRRVGQPQHPGRHRVAERPAHRDDADLAAEGAVPARRGSPVHRRTAAAGRPRRTAPSGPSRAPPRPRPRQPPARRRTGRAPPGSSSPHPRARRQPAPHPRRRADGSRPQHDWRPVPILPSRDAAMTTAFWQRLGFRVVDATPDDDPT